MHQLVVYIRTLGLSVQELLFEVPHSMKLKYFLMHYLPSGGNLLYVPTHVNNGKPFHRATMLDMTVDHFQTLENVQFSKCT